MTSVLSVIVPLAVARDPLSGIVVGGCVGVVAAVLGAALLGAVLNTLRRLAAGRRHPFRGHDSPPADRELRHAA